MFRNLFVAAIIFYNLNVIAAELDIDPPFEELDSAGSSQNLFVFEPSFLLKELQVYPLTKQRLEADLSQLDKGCISAGLQLVKTYSREITYISLVSNSDICPDDPYVRDMLNKMAWKRLTLIQKLLVYPYNDNQDQDTLRLFASVNQSISREIKPGTHYLKDKQKSFDFFLILAQDVFESILALIPLEQLLN